MVNQPPLLLVEIGNSTIKAAHSSGNDPLIVIRYDDLESFVRVAEAFPGDLLVAPVSEERSREVEEQLQREMPVIRREDLREFVGGSYATPQTLGLDRALNLLGLNGDGIVISCGTAITIDGILGGHPVWGAILPGFRTAAEGLHARIPALPLVELTDTTHLPARTSRESVANGVLLGTARAAQALAHDLASLFTGPVPRVVLTGGDAELLSRLWLPPDVPALDNALLFRGMIRSSKFKVQSSK